MTTDHITVPPIEFHPFPPFIPPEAKLLIMGTFPPKKERWSMEFYYPNRINDFWRVIGKVFFDNPMRFIDSSKGEFRLDDIRNFLTERGIALSDTGAQVQRLRDNASDKFLQIVKPVNLDGLLEEMPRCHVIATTGEKAAATLAEITGSEAPAMGKSVDIEYSVGQKAPRRLTIFRMPSTSRAYPMSLDRKAEFYRELFKFAKLL